ncbi:Alpha/Beta hydrolase protein [Ilyonectria destructans]|nr:Alpha/Beta hydrolase protein [Ilyonectria destructans]
MPPASPQIGLPALPKGVQGQVANLYAERLAKQGYMSVAFDALYQGSSEGLPSFLEDPDSKVSDVSAVVDYIQGLDYIDPDAIIVVGIYAGGGYGIAAATTDHRIKAVAAVSLVNIGDSTRQGWLNTLNQEGFSMLDGAKQQLQGTAISGNATAVPILLEPVPDTPPDLVDAWDYYHTPRGYFHTSQNVIANASTPLLTDKIHDKIKNTNGNATNILILGGRHMDFYGREQYLGSTLANITTFFNTHLNL